MFPTVVPVQGEVDLDKRPPLRALGLANEVHAGLVGGAVGLARVAWNTGADNVFPARRAAAVPRDDVVEVQILPLENFPTILAGVLVALKDVVPGEFHFFLGHPVIHEQQDDLRDADAEGDGVDGIVLRSAGGDIAPLVKTKRAKRAVGIVHHHLGVALKKQGERATGGADIDRLPKAV